MDKISKLGIVELKTLCELLELPTSGIKATLLERIAKVDEKYLEENMNKLENLEACGDYTQGHIKDKFPITLDDEKEVIVHGDIQHLVSEDNTNNHTLGISDLYASSGQQQNHSTDNGVSAAAQQKQQYTPEQQQKQSGSFYENELLKPENELLRREMDLLKRECEFTRKQTDFGSNSGGANEESVVPFSVLMGFVADYDGETDGALWISQLKNIVKIYKLSDNITRALIATKLKGKAQQWLHLRGNVFGEGDVETFLLPFCVAFSTKESKLSMRKKFESYAWQYGDCFLKYFNEKVSLADPLHLDEDKLIEYVIDGIPNAQIKTQAMMARYRQRDELLQVNFR